MTDNQYPILADGLFDGGLAADVAPKELRTAVTLLNAAGRPGSEAELASMAARVRQFSAEINAAAKSPARPTGESAIADAPPQRQSVFVSSPLPDDGSLATDATRNSPMFAARISRKALTIVAITLLAAGTAAAAAGGALPMFEDSSDAVVEDHGPNTVVDGSQPTDTAVVTVADRVPSETDPVITVVDVTVPTDFIGVCSVWATGAAADATGPMFVGLQTAAVKVALTIDEYCTSIQEPAPADDATTTDTEPADDATAVAKQPSDDPPAVVTPADDPPADVPTAAAPPVDETNNEGHGHHGNGNHGNGNGNGNHGNDDHGDDEHGNNHGNGNNGNGNNGNGNNGNHGNGNNGNGHGNSGKGK